MTSITGSIAPPHRRFDEQTLRRQIRNRYRALREKIPEQVKVLQSDERFLSRCERFYEQGFKDWHILAAVYNLIINRRAEDLKLDLRNRSDGERFKDVAKTLKGVTYPAEVFLTDTIEIMFMNHALTCLLAYGFEDRGVGLASQPVMKFMRERMKHFEFDIPHSPMFGRPPGDWPTV